MTWIRIDDQMPDHPKIVAAGPAAAWLFVSMICYSSRHLTDGFVPDAAISKLSGITRPTRTLRELNENALITRQSSSAPGWQINDYNQYQRTRAEIEEISAKRAIAGRKGGRPKKATSEQVANQFGKQKAPQSPESRVHTSPTPPSPCFSDTDMAAAGAATEEDHRPTDTAHLLADHAIVTRQAEGELIRNPTAYRQAILDTDGPAWHQRASELAAEHPTWTHVDIAEAINPTCGPDDGGAARAQAQAEATRAHLDELAANAVPPPPGWRTAHAGSHETGPTR